MSFSEIGTTSLDLRYLKNKMLEFHRGKNGMQKVRNIVRFSVCFKCFKVGSNFDQGIINTLLVCGNVF